MADGIKLGFVELQADFASNGLYFSFASGGLQSLATYRGEDDVMPEARGRYPGNFMVDQREVSLHGFVRGDGADAQALRESFRANFDILLNQMQPNTLVTITVFPPNFGLAVGYMAALASCRPQRIVGPEPTQLWYEGWEGTLELVCIDSPPEWVVTAVGS